MNCFSFLEKFILARCYPNGGPAGDPQAPVGHKPVDQPLTQVPSYSHVPFKLNSASKSLSFSEEEDLFKDLAPIYTATKTVSAVPSEGTFSHQLQIDEEEHGDWGTEDISID